MDFLRLEKVYLAALDLSPGERAAFIHGQCGDEPELAAKVREMLAGAEGPDSDDNWETDLVVRSEDGDHFESKLTSSGDQDVPASLVGQVIGGHEIEGLLAVGGMGSVFAALQPVTRRRVALKILRPELLGEALVRRFTLEVEVLGRLHHPNIAQIYEGGNDLIFGSEIPYFTMEFVPNAMKIDEYVAREKLSVDETLDLFEPICEAMIHAHLLGAIHRDLKPENILIDAVTNEPTPKVIDFGIARFSEEGRQRTQLTTAGQVMGTLETMSPEQARGGVAEIDVRTDVYALGVVLYMMLTTKPPIATRGKRIPEAIRAVLEDIPQTPSHLRSEIPRELDAILLKTLSKEADARYSSTRALLDDVQAFRRGETILARAPEPLEVLRLTVRRYRTILTSFGVILLATIAAAVISLRFAAVATEKSEQLRQVAYRTSMTAASSAINRAEFDAARRFLADSPTEFRGWEWTHLSQRLTQRRTTLGPPLDVDWRYGIRFSNDGNYYATFEDGSETIDLWLAESGSKARTFKVEGDVVWMDFDDSFGLRAQVSNSNEGRFYRWSLDGEEFETWPAPDRFRYSTQYRFADYTPRAGGLVAINSDGTLRVLDLSTRSIRFETHLGGQPMRGVFSDDGTAYAAAHRGRDDRYVISVFETSGWTTKQVLKGPNDRINDMCFLPSGKGLVVASADGGVYVWNSSAGEGRPNLSSDDSQDPTLVLNRQGEAAEGVAVTDDGTSIVSYHADGKIRHWNAETGQNLGAMGLEAPLTGGIAIRPGTRQVAGISAGIPLFVWELPSSDPSLLVRHESYANPIEIDERAGLVLSGGWDGYVGREGCIRWTDLRTGTPVGKLGPPGSAATDLELQRDSSEFLVSIHSAGVEAAAEGQGSRPALLGEFRQGLVARVSSVTGDVLATVPLKESVFDLALSPDGTRAVASSVVGDFWVLDAKSLAILHERIAPTGQLSAWRTAPVAWDPQGRWLAVCVAPYNIELWAGSTYETVGSWSNGSRVRSLTFSSDGRYLVSTSDDQIARVWSPVDGTEVASLEGHGASVLCAAFHPTENRLVTAGRGGAARIWNTEDFSLITTLQLHDSYIYDVEWTADGQTLVTSSGDGSVRQWSSTASDLERAQAINQREQAAADIRGHVGAALATGADPVSLGRDLAGNADLRRSQLVWQEILWAFIGDGRVNSP